MRFTCTVDLDLPIERVVELYDDPANREHWQDGYLRAEPLSGTPGELGAKARLLFRQGKGEMELIETITVRNPPFEFSATYEHEHMVNTMTNRFTSLDAKTTRWECCARLHEVQRVHAQADGHADARHVQATDAEVARPVQGVF